MLRMIDLMIRGHDWYPNRTPLDPYAAGAAVRLLKKGRAPPCRRPLYWRACEGESNARWTPTLEEVRQRLLQGTASARR